MGIVPFAGNDPIFWHHHANVEPSAPTRLNPQLPAYVAQAVLKALAKQRDTRYSDVNAFVKALQAPPDPALKQYEAGDKTADICRKLGISQATFYMWKKQYAGLGVQELRELRSLRDENSRLKRIVADLTLDRQILQEIVSKKL